MWRIERTGMRPSGMDSKCTDGSVDGVKPVLAGRGPDCAKSSWRDKAHVHNA